MNRNSALFKSEFFLQNNLHLYINRYAEDFTVPFHSHEFIEYCYVAEGKGFHHIEHETFPVHKGMLYAIPIGVSHVFRPSTPQYSEEPLIVYNCLFDKQMIELLSSKIEDASIIEHLATLENKTHSYFTVFDRDGSIERLMSTLYREMSVPSIGTKTMLHALLSQLITLVYRLKVATNEKSTTDNADFTGIINFIEQHLSESITLTDLSHYSKWSNRHLQRLFLKHFGQPFRSYLQNTRIQKSCELLRESSHKISVISQLVGYHDNGSFHAVFKKIVGKSPTEYRKLYKE
ncbi:AraC family transcriptional regulator [Paenibacillus sp. YIM B09110]|uniref:AraC family transcriptional regulator n=1 Tax=Paenibacillus sp. YIM B09110 TaxID=3126102 RepID=UPI00301E5F10